MNLPDTVTWGHVLIVAGLLSGLFAVIHFLRWFRQRRHGRGTPQYADGRLARRASLYALALAVVLFAAGSLTPLCETPIL